MIKNAYLSIKKNVGKTILLFIIMLMIANLIIAGLSIKSATQKSIDSLRTSLGNEVTLTTNFRNMMKDREQGQAISDIATSITIEMADQLKSLKYVSSYNYNISTSASSDTLSPIELESTSQTDEMQRDMPSNNFSSQSQSSGDFTIEVNSTMENLDAFTSQSSNLIEGRLLTDEDSGTNNCVIETSLATENSLAVGDTISVNTTVGDQTITKELTIVGIYEIETTQIGGPNRSNPVNTIYTDINVGQELTGNTTDITSASYYLDDPENVEAFKTLAQSKTDIDFETFTLDANDQMYTRNASNLENTESFATIFLVVVIVAGSAILCLILILTIRNRYYEFGVFLSLGQSKLKIMGQQLIEIGTIALVAFVLSLGTGKIVSNVVSNMLVNNQSDTEMRMEIRGESVNTFSSDDTTDIASEGTDKAMGGSMFNDALNAPESEELDVSLTTQTTLQLAGITTMICIVSTLIPSIYVLRLTPREILVRKDG